jgi:glycosyltransferase involved in cell wall biosynthesis
MQQFGFNVIGFISGNLGQGTAARSTIKILLEKDLPVSVIDVDAGFGRSGFDNSFNHLVQSDNQSSYAVNLIQLNPPEISQLLKQGLPCFTDPTRLNIIVPFWELPRLPQSWIPVLEKMDMILAPTHFIEYMMATQVPGVPVRHYPQTISIPDTIVPNRAAFNLPEDNVLFVTSFEMFSDINRKNTWAVIEAFDRAFKDNSGVNLIVNINNARKLPSFTAELDKLQTVAAKNRCIILLEKGLSYLEVLTLYASSDVLISLHRAEGLGLSPMEAMFLGKPVIATGWSGNMDFMNDVNSCLVPSILVPVCSNAQSGYNPSYIGGSTVWAEPNIDSAVFWMQRLAGDSQLRQVIGKNAHASITERHVECCKGNVFDSIRTFYEHHWTMQKQTGFKKSRIASLLNTSQNVPLNNNNTQQANDLHLFVEQIVKLIENGQLQNALSIYDNCRSTFGNKNPQLQRIDEIINRLRIKIC